MKLIMENWRQFIKEAGQEEKMLEEGWKEWLLPVLMATNLSVGTMNTAQARPSKSTKAQVQKIVVRGGMTQAQKNKLLKMPTNLRMLLKDLNAPLKRNYDNMSMSVRQMNMRILGMKGKDFPAYHEITMQELKDFLASGKKPVVKKPPVEKTKEKGGFLSKVKGALRYLDRDSAIGLDTGWFDDN